MKISDKKNEKGFASGFVLLFVVTLALMGVGGAILMKSEGKRLGSNIESLQTDYSAQSAMWFAIQATAVSADTLKYVVDNVPFSIGSATISDIDTFISNNGKDAITVEARTANCVRRITAEIEKLPGVLAIESTNSVNNVDVRDQNNNENNQLIDQNRAAMRVIDDANLQAIAVSQGYNISGNYTPPDGWPNGSYYNAPGVPNVTYINGNLTVSSGDDVFGIFYVQGNVNIEYGAQVHGIIYAPNGANTVTLNGPSFSNAVEGGIISAGPIEGECGFLNLFDSQIIYNPQFIRGFMACGNIDAPDRVETQSYTYN